MSEVVQGTSDKVAKRRSRQAASVKQNPVLRELPKRKAKEQRRKQKEEGNRVKNDQTSEEQAAQRKKRAKQNKKCRKARKLALEQLNKYDLPPNGGEIPPEESPEEPSCMCLENMKKIYISESRRRWELKERIFGYQIEILYLRELVQLFEQNISVD